MSRTTPVLDLASSLLSRNIPVTGRHALVTALLSGSDPVGFTEYNPDRDLESLAMRLFDVVEGGTFASEFCADIANFLSPSPGGSDNASVEEKEIEAIASKAREFVRVTLGNSSLDSTAMALIEEKSYKKCILNNKINYVGQTQSAPYTIDKGIAGNVAGGIFNDIETGGAVDPIKSSPSLAAIELMNPRIGMTTRDSSAVSIFTSLIPPVEMSRCVPYISIKTSTSGSSTVQGGNLTGLSLLSYLIGRGEPAPTLGSGVDASILLTPQAQSIPAAMDIFTAPQTLVPSAGSAAMRERGNIPAVLDRFRPLMTLKGLNFNVAPTKGFMSYKSGKVELVLHDRSRLGEVAGFVKPGLYAGTEMEIEYGWSHPDGVNSQRMNKAVPGSDLYNPVGAFLDSMRVKEKYNIVNSSFNFDDVGQVNISLTIAMKGARSLDIASIADCSAIPASSNLETLMTEISDKISEMKGTSSEKFGKLYDETLISSAGSTSKALSLDEKALSELRAKINAIKGSSFSAEDKELAGMLEKLFAEGGAADNYKSGVDEAVEKEFENLASGTEIFPCSDSQITGNPTSITLPNVTSDNVISSPISLGRVLLSFVGKPLVRSGQYDEVQFIFHTFNERASFMRDLSIAKFPLEKEALQQGVSDILKKNLKMSSMQFIGFLMNKFVADVSATVYGFRQLYEKDPETGEYKRKESKAEGDSKQEAAARAEFAVQQQEAEEGVLKAAGISDGTFRIPKVSVYPECVPHRTQKGKTILRMHVVDETCTSFGSMYDLLKSARGGNITSFGFSNDPEHPLLKIAPELQESTIEQRRQAIINDMVSKGVVKNVVDQVDNTGEAKLQYSIDVGKLLEGKSISKVKKFISEGVPTIRFGSATGTIVSAGLSSQSDPALTNINIINMNKSTTGTPDLARARGLPMQIAPTECTLEMLGCPLMQFGQNFFIDFGTGTTADNIYFVTGLDHKIEAGSFTTSVKLTFLDAYGSYRSSNLKVKTASATLNTMLANSGVQSVVTTNAETSSTTTNPETSGKATGTPSDFITALGLSPSSIYADIQGQVSRGVVVVVNKVTKSARTLSNGKNYFVLTNATEQEFSKLKSENLDPNTYSLVIAPISAGTVGYVSAGVYNVTTLTPASRDERNGLVGWLGIAGSVYSELTVGTNDWAGFVASL